ncbi:MAG: gliding motility-associated C-terminal domain-containing protein [Flavobacteriales bacterium]
MKKNYAYLFIFFATLISSVQAQFISRSEPVPFNCPSVCASGTLVLKVPQIENVGPGTIQAHLSNVAGNFGAGAQILEVSRFSTNQGATWQNGPYNFAGNIQNLFIEIVIPQGTAPGNQYTIRMRSSNGYQSPDLFQCGGNNRITVTPFVSPLPPIAANTFGINQWFAHVFTWTPTVGGLLNTPAIVNQQDFFNPNNYRGHIIRNSLSFDVNFGAQGWVPGNWNDGTSIGCGNTLTTNFSMRWLRRENFAPGLYRIDIAGDDGIRLSVDGGTTWLLTSFIEQEYSASFRTTNTAFPSGICLSGETNLVVEYFQRPADARITVTITQLSQLQIGTPQNQEVCAGQSASFSVGNAVAGLNYQWQISTDGGANFTNLTNTAPYSNVTAAAMTVNPVTAAMNGHQFRCVVSGSCATPLNSSVATLTVQDLPNITQQPQNAAACNQSINFSVQASGNSNTFQWQVSTNGGGTYTNLTNTPPYSGVNTATLTINPAAPSLVGNLYRCIVTGCNTPVNSQVATFLPGDQVEITLQPINQNACSNQQVSFSTQIQGQGSFQWQLSTNGGANFNNITNGGAYSGANTGTLTINPVTGAMNNHQFRCLIGGDCDGDLFTQVVTLTVTDGLQVSQHPQNANVCPGENVTFTFVTQPVATGYQWFVSSDGVNFVPLQAQAGVSGEQSSQLNLNTGVFNAQGLSFYCDAVNNCQQNVQSNTVQIILNEVPQFVTQPEDIAACVGEQIQFQVSLVNSNVTYQWQSSSDGLNFNNLSNGNGFNGVNTATLTINPVTAALNNFYFRVVTEACGVEVVSESAQISLGFAPIITTQPLPATICEGETAIFITVADHALTFQWQVNFGNGFVDLQDGNGVTGSTSNTLQISSLPNGSGSLFPIRCIVSGTCAPDATTQVVNLIINTPPVILTQPENLDICTGSEAVVFVQASGFGTTYQWQQLIPGQGYVDLNNNDVFTGVNAASLLISNISTEIDELQIRVQLNGCGQSINSNTIKLNVQENLPVFVPNAFSPNGDGLNPVFKIYTDGNPKFLMQIFNRWGELIYSFNKMEDGWDGSYKGAPVQDGIYVYRLNVETACETFKRTGFIKLIKD